MANFPTNLDTIKKDWANDSPVKDTHPDEHNLVAESVEALEAKVGVDGSAVTTTHDYKLSGVPAGDKASSLTGTETLTNKTLTAPTITGGSIISPSITNPTGLDKNDVGLNNVVNLAQVATTTAQTIAGVKTFSSSPIIPDPTTAQQPVTKAYFEANSSSLGSSTAIELTTYKAISAGKGLRFLSTGITQGSNTTGNAVFLRQSGDFVRIFQPFIMIGTENNLRVSSRLRSADFGNGSPNINSRVLKIFAYDASEDNKSGTLIQTITKANFDVDNIGASGILDEYDFAPDASLVKGTKYTFSLEYNYVSGSASSDAVLSKSRYQAAATLNAPEAGYYQSISEGGSLSQGVGYTDIEFKQLPDAADQSKILEGTLDNTNLIGFSEENVLIDSVANVKIGGLIGGFTGLTVGLFYSVDTDGSLIEGTSGTNAGRAITSTQIHFTR